MMAAVRQRPFSLGVVDRVARRSDVRFAAPTSGLLPLENCLDIPGELGNIEGDISVAPVRHMAPFGHDHGPGDIVQRKQGHGPVAPALSLSSRWKRFFLHRVLL